MGADHGQEDWEKHSAEEDGGSAQTAAVQPRGKEREVGVAILPSTVETLIVDVYVADSSCTSYAHLSRLRTLLQSEEEQYTTEMTGRQETVLERQAKMRERAKMLRERRETERLALVEKKLDQRWR